MFFFNHNLKNTTKLDITKNLGFRGPYYFFSVSHFRKALPLPLFCFSKWIWAEKLTQLPGIKECFLVLPPSLLLYMVCIAWSQGLIFSSWCICFNLAGLPGDWASCMYGHWYIAVFTWFLEHCSDTCYWWQHYWLQLRGPCTLSSSSLPSNQSSSTFNKLSSAGDLVALG